ncbi:MAG: VanZ family protein [Desulfobulbaceae bacterium]
MLLLPRLLLRFVPMLAVMGTIFFFSHQPGNTLYLPEFPGIDKICHLAIYALLALTVVWCLGPGGEGTPVKVALKTVLFCLLYAISDELHQAYVPQRSVSGLDLLADLSGVIVVCAIWLSSRRLRVAMESGCMALAKRLGGVYNDNSFKNES